MIYNKRLPFTKKPDLAWACRVWAFVEKLMIKHKVDQIDFDGAAAEQWSLACAIIEAHGGDDFS